MGSFWSDGPCVIYFIRRFGCAVGRYQAKQVNALASKVDKVRFIAIAPESLGLAEFLEGKYWSSDLYIDEGKKLFEEMGFKRLGCLKVIGTMAQKKFREMSSSAKKEGITGDCLGDGFQLGGCFVVDKTGDLLYEFKQHEIADEPDLDAIAKVLGADYIPEENSAEIPKKKCCMKSRCCK